MAYSYTTATGDGSTMEFTVPFPYLAKGHVHVEVDGVDTPFTWVTDTIIEIFPAPAAGTRILIYRSTSPSTRLVDYTSPSALTEEDLDADSLQAFYLAQEAIDVVDVTISQDPVDGHWDAQGRRIKNVADPEQAQDAATKAYVDAYMAGQGNVPIPDNPDDDGKVLTASGGTFDWQTPSVTADQVVNPSDILVTAEGGSTASTLAERFGNMLSVLDFGAVGDGVTDNYAAFNAAFTAAAGKRLFVPKGVYRVDLSNHVDFRPPANVILEGEGRESVIEVYADGNSSPPRTLFNAVSDNLTIRDLKIRVAELPSGSTLFVFNHGNRGLTMERVEIDGGCQEVSGALNWGTEVIRLPNTGDYSDILILNCEWHHFKLGFLKTNTATSTQRRIKLLDSYFHDFFSKVFTFNTPAGIVDDVLVRGNTFQNSLATTVGIPGEHFGGGASVSNMRIIGNSFLGSNGSEVLHFEERVRNLVIADNTLYADGSLCSIQENNVGDGNYIIPYYITITGNTCRRLGGSPNHEGIVLVSNAIPQEPGRRIVIANNVLENYAVGIRLNRPNNEIICHSNVLEGCTEGMLVTTGSPSIRDNLFSNCSTGITLADGGLVGPQFFRNCPVFITSTQGLASLEGWRINPEPFTIPTGQQDIILAPEGTRIDGKLIFHLFRTSSLYRYGSRDIVNSASFTDTDITSGGIGNISIVGVFISNGNLVLRVNNQTGSEAPDCRLSVSFNGHHTFS